MVDAEALARSDIESYANKAEVFQNLLPAVKGGAFKAPGTRYVSNTLSNAFAVLRPWRYSLSQAFVMEMTAGRIRLIQDGTTPAQVVTGAATGTFPGTWVNNSSGTSTVTPLALGSPVGMLLSLTYTPVSLPWDSGMTGSPVNPVLLKCDGTGNARATLEANTASPSSSHSLAIEITRRGATLRIGTTAGAGQILTSTYGDDHIDLDPGYYVFTFTPGVSVFYIDLQTDDIGTCQIKYCGFLTANQALELPSPLTADTLRLARFDQQGDLRWMVENSAAPRIIQRTSNSSWGVRAFMPSNGPFLDGNTNESHTMTPSAVSGAITVTSNQQFFQSGHVGALMKMTHSGQFETAILTGDDQYTDHIRVTGIDSGRVFYYSISGTFSATVTLQRSVGSTLDWVDVSSHATATGGSLDDTYDNQIIYYRLGIKSGAYTSGSVTASLTYSAGSTEGIVRILSVLGPYTAEADVLDTLGKAAATTDWSEGAWSTLRGWPSALAFQDGRLCFWRGQDFWASQSDDYWNFDLGDGEGSDAIARTIATGDTAPVQWGAGGNRLAAVTSSGELHFRSSSLEEPITPDNVNVREWATRGSAAIQGVKSGGNIVYVNASGQRLLRLRFDDGVGAYIIDDLTRLNETAAGPSGFVDIAVQTEPEPRVWCVRADGKMSVLTLSEAESVVGWSEVVTSLREGYDEDNELTYEEWEDYESVCVLRGVPEDHVYVTVKREVGDDITGTPVGLLLSLTHATGDTVRFVERFEPERWSWRNRPTAAEKRSAWRVHAGLSYSGTSTTMLSGLSHLARRTVAVWDGGDVGTFQVTTGGEIELPYAVTSAIVGLPYQGRYRSGKLAVGGEAGSTVGQKKRLVRATMLVHHTQLGSIKVGTDFNDLRALPDGVIDFVTDEPRKMFSGEIEDTEFAAHTAEWTTDPRFCFQLGGAGPGAILGYLPVVSVNEKL